LVASSFQTTLASTPRVGGRYPSEALFVKNRTSVDRRAGFAWFGHGRRSQPLKRVLRPAGRCRNTHAELRLTQAFLARARLATGKACQKVRGLRYATERTKPLSSLPMTFSELDREIRDLCSKALATKKPEELATICAQLRAALQEHMRQTRDLASETLRGIDRAGKQISKLTETRKRKAGK
jgi:hypothetical protein